MVESPSEGEASSAATASNKAPSVECPDCGESWNHAGSVRYHLDSSDCDGYECPTCGEDNFYNRRGVKVHHKQEHGESLAVNIVQCEWCGSDIERRDYELKEEGNFFCGDKGCYGEWQSENKTGENHPRWVDRVNVQCDWCGSSIERYPSHVSNRNFCASGCEGAWKSEYKSGENHPSYGRPGMAGEDNPMWEGGPKTIVCEQCGDEKQVQKHEIGRFCSTECMAEWQSENWSGEDSPLYGGSGPWYYGPNWDEQSEKARERDGYQCQKCGKLQENHWRTLPVHHLKRINWFRENYDAPEWWEKGNKLSNLVTLCDSCHSPWEGIPVRPQLTD